ncbi:uncharacterized protein BX663DRAFT_323239 [Cokeromyces recurvatus]|uniref:uncharacterized protein n=1 Tax=Cokeromyces recurvatus TaxID=90255 RepID=UPI00221E4A86|nr:uncharacterized protein BX663DRAFT_323239 [Cokeromyces recurvatus]KAI7904626.1 hypothetical protein BX663DRAFT_323239 [Cokeromyces recurvatus]
MTRFINICIAALALLVAASSAAPCHGGNHNGSGGNHDGGCGGHDSGCGDRGLVNADVHDVVGGIEVKDTLNHVVDVDDVDVKHVAENIKVLS